MLFYIIIAYNFCFYYNESAGVSFLFALDDFSEGHSDYWTFGLLGFRIIRLLSIRTIGPSDYRAFWLLGRHRFSDHLY